jgi:hypothetical protein
MTKERVSCNKLPQARKYGCTTMNLEENEAWSENIMRTMKFRSVPFAREVVLTLF